MHILNFRWTPIRPANWTVPQSPMTPEEQEVLSVHIRPRHPSVQTILDLDLDGPDDDGLSFVDQEQREERKLPVAKDNAEVE